MNNFEIKKLLENGDERSFSLIFDALYEPLVAYCFQFIHDKDAAKDLAQNSFIRLWEKKSSINLNISIKGYLYSTAYHLFIDDFRKEKVNQSFLDLLKYKALQKEVELSEEDFEKKVERVNRAIEELPNKCRIIFIMHKKQGFSYKEIAENLDLSPKTVETQIGIALQKIRDKFRNDPNFFLLIFRNRLKYLEG